MSLNIKVRQVDLVYQEKLKGVPGKIKTKLEKQPSFNCFISPCRKCSLLNDAARGRYANLLHVLGDLKGFVLTHRQHRLPWLIVNNSVESLFEGLQST